jgi:prepilin-type N-terminal cleavage/methylation domain-containing protein
MTAFGPAMRRPRPEAAFTLIELVAVLALLGVLLAASPMALDALVPERELEKEMSRLGTTIELLHQQAILDRAPYAIHYDTEKHRWAVQVPEEVIEDAEREDAGPRTLLVLDEDVDLELLEWRALPSGFKLHLYEGSRRIATGSFAVTFRPGGTVDPHTLVIESDSIPSLDDADRTRTIKVNFPGFVSYARGRVLDDFRKTEAELGR